MGVFEYCTGLTSVTLPNSLRYIEINTFYGCRGLTSIDIPNSVTNISERAFGGCIGLTDVSVSWPTPLSITADVFSGVTPGNITLHVPASTETDYRAATVWQDFLVGGVASALTVTPATANIAAAGGTVNLTVTANVNWTVVSSDAWAVVTPATGNNNGTVVVTAAANTGALRTATITISGGGLTQTVNITQAQPAPTLTVTPATVNIAATSDTVDLTVTANVNWTVVSSDAWAVVTPATGSNNGTVNVTVAANTGVQRTATITISGGGLTQTVDITQAEQPTPTLTVTPATVNIAAAGDTVDLTVTANVDWTAVSSDAWVVVTPATGSSDGTVNVAVTANTGAQRTATITISGEGLTQTVNITQAQPAPTLTVTPATVHIAAAGDTVDLTVTANVDWTVVSSDVWAIVTPASGSNNGTFSVSAAANPGSERTATITVSGGGIERTITFTQVAGEQDVFVDPVPPTGDEDTGGQLILRLNLPTDETISGSFRINLPMGLNLDLDNTKLVDELVSSYELLIHPLGNGVWQLEIRIRTALRSGTNATMRDIVHIAWTEESSLPSTTCEITISDLEITLGDQTVIRHDEIIIPVAAGNPTATVSPEAQKVWLHNGLLHVHTSRAEQVEVYALTGQLIYTGRKDVGQTVFNLTSIPRGILIVRGTGGWTEKVVNN
jgi:hypothetical protein